MADPTESDPVLDPVDLSAPVSEAGDEVELRSPPSWESLETLSDDEEEGGDPEDTVSARLSQAQARLSRSPGKSLHEELSELNNTLDPETGRWQANNDEDDDDVGLVVVCSDDSSSLDEVYERETPREPGTADTHGLLANAVSVGKSTCRHASSTSSSSGDIQRGQSALRKKSDLEVKADDLAEIDKKFYDALNSLTDTRLLWRVSTAPTVGGGVSGSSTGQQRLRTPSDRDAESVYDTVSSTSSSAPLLRKVTEELGSNRSRSKDEPAGTQGQQAQNSTTTGTAQPTRDPSTPSDNIGKKLLSKTLEHVKKSLGDLAPSPEAELFSQVMGTPSVYKISRVYIKNLLLLSISFMFLYTAFFSLRNLQSSLNQQGGLGLAGLACLSASFIVFCLVAPSIVHRVRPKYALVASMSGHIVFELANFYPSFYTIIPATLLLGCSMSCLWVAQGTYLTSVAVTYATVTGKKHDGIIGLFNGIFLFCLQLAQIIGNLLSSFIFNFSLWRQESYELSQRSPGSTSVDALRAANMSYNFEVSPIDVNTTTADLLTPSAPMQCGFAYCHANIIEHRDIQIGQRTLCTLLTIFVALGVVAMLITALCLDKLDVIFHRTKSSVGQQLTSLMNLHKEHKIWLLSLLLIFLGMEQAFMFGEVTKAFITCPLGIHMIGYIMVCFGACDSLTSFMCGQLQKASSTRILLTIGAFLHLSILTLSLFWQPDSEHVYLVFIFAGGLGVTDAIWQTQICNVIGCLYPKDREAAFASLRMYEGMGYTLAFSYAQYMCMDVKTYLLIGLLAVAMINYYIMDFLETRDQQQQLEQQHTMIGSSSYPPVDV